MKGIVVAFALTAMAVGLYMIDPWWLLVAAGALVINEAA